nr:PEGA domain-containing protein [Acidobacteriota bacterium]
MTPDFRVTRRRAGRRRVLVVAAALLLALPSIKIVAQQTTPEILFQEARRLFDALDYERSVVALDQAITALQAAPVTDSMRNERLAASYEMRARSKFGLGDQDGARADFELLLKLAPHHALSGQVSPRVVALYEETARDAVTTLAVAVTPATATVQVDGVAIPGPGIVRVAIGDHVVSATQSGYSPATQNITAVTGAASEVTLTLERVSSVIRVTTTPSDVEVRVDGAVAGKTVPATPSASDALAGISAPFVIADVATGARTVTLSRPCFVPVTQKVDVDTPNDYTVGPLTLQSATAKIAITANEPGAQVFVDGKDRGGAPVTVPDLCEGEHLVELRSRFGSFSRRVPLRAGSDVSVDATLKPAFALVSTSAGTAGPSQQDIRLIVERAFAASQTVTLIAPQTEDADKALKASQLSADWLATDASGRPVGASAQISGPLRRDASLELAAAFRTQGVGSVTMVGPSKVVLALLAAGSSTPDVIEVALDNPASIAAAVARLDASLSVSRPALGVQLVDVADVGVVVTAVDPAAGAGVQVGDIVRQAGGKPVTAAAAILDLVAARNPGDVLALDLAGPAGAAKKADLQVRPVPRLIGLSENGLLANRILLDLRPRLAAATDPYQQSVIRLNMAVAMARVQDWAGALEELQRVTLPEQTGVG